MSQAIYKINEQGQPVRVDTGAAGPIGPQGPAATNGAQGPAGPKGDKGDTGAQGPAGATGANGSGIDAQSIRGVNVSATVPTNGQALVFDGTNYVPGTVASGSYLAKSVAGGATVTLTAIEAQNGNLEFTGALTASINVIVPASVRAWYIKNSTSGAFTLTVKTSAGTGVAVTQGATAHLDCDGTNVVALATGGGGGTLAVASSPGGDKCIGGTASASTTYTPGDYGAANAFDNSDYTRWAATGAAANLNYDRGNGNGVIITSVKIYPHLDSGGTNDAPRSFNVKARNNGGTYTTLFTKTNQVWSNTNPLTFAFTNTVAYSEFQLEITAILGSNASVRKIEFIGTGAAGAAGTVTDIDKLNLDKMRAPIAASYVGDIVKKIEIFDAAGLSLGFIPVYATIT